MAKGCGNNSTEFWYYGRGNITSADIPTTYNTGTAYQGGSTNILGVGTTWTAAMVGESFDFINADGTVTPAGKITSRASNTSIFVTQAQTVASAGSRLPYVIKDRGQYPVGENINLTLAHPGIGRGAAFKVWLRPLAGSIPLVAELDKIDVLTGGLDYGTRRKVDTSGAVHIWQTNLPPVPILGGSASGGSTLRHGKVEVSLSRSNAWHQAKTFKEYPHEGLNAVASVEIEYVFNDTQSARVSLMNRSPNISSIFSDVDSSGQYTDFFREGQEVLLRDHTTHIVLFRGTIQEMEDSWEVGGGPSIRFHLTDHLRELDDTPAEILRINTTPAAVKLPSAKIYSIVDEHTRTLKQFKGEERRLAFVEGPLYRVGSGAAAPTPTQEGLVASERGHGHQVGRRYAFENSWYPRDASHFATSGDGEAVYAERFSVRQTGFNKGKLKLATVIKNLAAQEKQGGYIDGGATDTIRIESGDEWGFHVSPNILTPTPEKLTGTSTDGDNDLWITDNPRTGTTDSSGNGVNYVGISPAAASDGKGFYPSDIGKIFTLGGTSRAIVGVGPSDTGHANSRLELAQPNHTWADSTAFSIAEALPSIPQFNYFEVGSRPAFAFDPAQGEIVDAQNHSVTMMLPTQPVEEQGIAKLRATTAEQSSQSVMQPSLEGTEHGTVITDITGTYGIKNVLTWEVQIKTGGAKIEYKYGTIGTNMDSVAFTGDITLSANTPHALAYGVRITFENATGHTAGTIYRFTSYPQFDNTRALRIMNSGASWSKLNHEKYSTAIVYYNAEASSEENYGTSNQIRMDLIYGWNVQNRSWVWHDSADSEGGTTNIYRLRVHQGDAANAHAALPVDGSEDECINFINDTQPRTAYSDLGEGGNAFFTPSFLMNILDNFIEVLKPHWDDVEEIDGVEVAKFQDFMYRNKHLTEGEWNISNIGSDMKASRGKSASEYVDVYRGRYSKVLIDHGGNARVQIEWRRWESGKAVAAIQWVDKPAPFKEAQANSYVHKSSGGGEILFPFGPGKDEQTMVKALVSFDDGTNEENWPITNTYDEKGRPQAASSNWVDFPFVRLVGQTTGTKIDFDADIATRPDAPSWTGRPMDSWGVLMPLRRTYTKDNSTDEIRHDIVSQLHRRVSDTRAGKFTINKAPYYWLDAQVDGWELQGSTGYGNSNLDPGAATTNPNANKVIRFKMQKLGSLSGTSYYNPLQYGVMIGNVVRFYNHKIGTGGAADSQDFHDNEEFCYGIITNIEPITTTPSGGTYPQNEDSYPMCGWIEVELTHTARKTATTTNGIKYRRVVADVSTSNSGYSEDLLNPGTALSPVADYTGPTRIRVYNMLYPGYIIRVEDRMNDIYAKHLIEGMVFSSRTGILQTDFQTHGKKADQDIRKWGTTPMKLTPPITEVLDQAIRDGNANSASGVGNIGLNPDTDTAGGAYFWFGDIGASTDSPIGEYETDDPFVE